MKLFSLVVLMGCWQASGQGQVVLFMIEMAIARRFNRL